VLYLSFEKHSWGLAGYDRDVVKFLLPFFTDISPTNVIERVVISCTYNEGRESCQPSWNSFVELKNILVKDRFRSLREVVLYTPDVKSQDVVYGLAHCAEGLRRQGIEVKFESGAFCAFFFLKLDTQKKTVQGSHHDWKRMIEES
jgi:hypothetical protein